MLKLCSIRHARHGQAFVDYMAYRGIELQMLPEEEGRVGIWLTHLEHQVEVQAELSAFLREPMAAKYQSASWDMAETRNAKYQYAKPNIWQHILQKSGVFTNIVMFFCMLVFGLLFIGFGDSLLSLMHFPASIEQRWQLWRLFSHAFMHFSTLHIIFNLLWWWLLGGQIEKCLGSSKLVQLFLLSALFSGLAQYQFVGPAFGGLSGVVYALLGFSWVLEKRAPERGIALEKSYFGFMILWLIIGFAEPFGMKIANMAHLFGLITGLTLGFIESRKAKTKMS